MAEALNEALHEEMERDPSVFVIGEDIGMHRRAVPASRPACSTASARRA